MNNTRSRDVRGAASCSGGASTGASAATGSHTWKVVRIGRVREDGLFDVVWSSNTPIQPQPFPTLRSRATWEKFLADLNQGWGGAWASQGPT